MQLRKEAYKLLSRRLMQWAGTFRPSDKSIGVPWEHIAQRLHQLLGNHDAQIEFKAFPADELAICFHRDLVWIHPFPNGNGRHARLMADLLILRLGGERFKWGAKANLASAGAARDDYIVALKEADKGNFAPLIQFARI